MINLDSLSLKELLELQKQLPMLISQRQEEVRKSVLRQASDLAAKHGLTLDDIMKQGRRRHTVKYINPSDSTQTWTGVGSRPKWVREWLAAGKQLDDLKVPGA